MTTTLAQARRMSAPRAIALCQCFNGALEYQAGHWQEAEAALDESIHLYRQIGAASGEALACQRLGVVQTARGRLGEALAILEEGVLAAERALMRAHCLTRLYAAMARNRLAASDLAAADQALSFGLAMGRRHGHCTTCDGLLLPAAVSVRVVQQDFEAAEVFCRQLDQAAGHYGSQMWLAMAHQARGELAAGQQEWEAALSAYAEAYQAFRAAGHDYEAARCLEATAAVHMTRRSPGDSEVAAQARSQAGQILERLTAL